MKRKTLLLSALIASAAMTANAQGATPTYTKATLPDGISEGFFRGGSVFADVNNDGIMDLVVKGRDLDGGWAPKVQLVLGGDAGFASATTLLEDMDIYEHCINLFDFNNDGNVDLLLTCYNTPLLYKGNGDGTFTKVENFALEDNFSISDNDDNKTAELYYTGLTFTADFDGDGIQDILTKDNGGNPILYHGNGDGTFAKIANSNLYAVRGGTMAIGDFNRDGYLDVAATGWSDEAGTDVCVVNKNNGDGTFTTVVSDNLIGAEKGAVMFADINNDGYPDLFVTGESCPEGWNRIAYVFKNNDDGTFGAKTATELPGSCKGGADWADVNGDGIVDIALMGYNDKAFLTKHFSVWNGSDVTANTAPTAPAGLGISSDNGVVTFAWDAATDKESPAASLRYNVYVKLNDGTIFTNVPADPATGKLRLGNVDAALSTTSLKLNVNIDDIAEWGVQTIDGGKLASPFAKGGTPTGINGVEDCAEGAMVAIYNVAGQRFNATAKGINIIKLANGKVKKVVLGK